MTTEETKAIFASLEEGLARLDAVTLAALYSQDCVVESPIAGVHIGRDAVERAYRRIFSAFPDFRSHTDELLIFGDRVVQMLTASGVDNGGFMGLPPTGRRFSVSAIFLFTKENFNQCLSEFRRACNHENSIIAHELVINHWFFDINS